MYFSAVSILNLWEWIVLNGLTSGTIYFMVFFCFVEIVNIWKSVLFGAHVGGGFCFHLFIHYFIYFYASGDITNCRNYISRMWDPKYKRQWICEMFIHYRLEGEFQNSKRMNQMALIKLGHLVYYRIW